jgi:hypothetical protein
MNDQSTQSQTNTLWDEDRTRRVQAIEALARFGESAGPALMVALPNDDRSYEQQDWENRDLRRAIIQIGEPAFQALLTVLLPGSDVVRAAAKTLQLWGYRRAVESLIAATADEQVVLIGRLYAIDALADFRDPA